MAFCELEVGRETLVGGESNERIKVREYVLIKRIKRHRLFLVWYRRSQKSQETSKSRGSPFRGGPSPIRGSDRLPRGAIDGRRDLCMYGYGAELRLAQPRQLLFGRKMPGTYSGAILSLLSCTKCGP